MEKISKMPKYMLIAMVLLGLLILSACHSTLHHNNFNHTDTYSPDFEEKHASYKISHLNNEKSRLWAEIPSYLLTYKPNKEINTSWNAHFKIKISLYKNGTEPIKYNTFEYTLTDSLYHRKPGIISEHFTFDLPLGFDYMVGIELYDLHARKNRVHWLTANKLHPYTPLFFKILKNDDDQNYPFILSQTDEHITLKYASQDDFTLNIQELDVQCGFPLPVYMNTKVNEKCYKFGAPELLAFESGSAQIPNSDTEMFYVFHDSFPKQGFLIQFFHDQFPFTDPSDADPLRYITNNKEFENLSKSDYPTWDIEKLWSTIGGNSERAAHLSALYNERIFMANKLFSSYLPGWKTDRGMVYILFGQPEKVHRKNNMEYWNYPAKMGQNGFQFTFEKIMDSPFDNNFKLKRESGFQHIWNQALLQWRR